MNEERPTIQHSQTAFRRILGLVVLGAGFGILCGAVVGCIFGMISRVDLIDAVAGGLVGGLVGGTMAMFFVGICGGRKSLKHDQMKSAAFSGAFGTILGGMGGIGVLYLLERLSGRHAGTVDRLKDDLSIILILASAAGSVVTWGVSHLSSHERRLQYAVLGMFLASVGCFFITPATIPFGVGGAVAGLLSQRLLVRRQ